MDDCTCLIASHITCEERLLWLWEAVDSATRYFPTLLSVSCSKELESTVEKEVQNFPCLAYLSTQQKTQFEHLAFLSEEVESKYVIFLDDDDFFLDTIPEMLPLLLARYGQHEGVQLKGLTPDPGCTPQGDVVCDFSGSFCSTIFLGDFLVEYEHELETSDCDCLFRSLLTAGGKGLRANDSVYYHNEDIDEDVLPFVYRREHHLERDWEK